TRSGVAHLTLGIGHREAQDGKQNGRPSNKPALLVEHQSHLPFNFLLVNTGKHADGRAHCSLYSTSNLRNHRSRKKTMRTELLRFNGAVERDPAIDAWMKEHAGELGAIAHEWFEVMRKCGDEVRELLHDGCPVACLGDAPFGYVNVFTSHVNVGFFHGASLSDPARLLQGNGKYMRHVKLRPGTATNAVALSRLIDTAY